jgi:hypothetical protein
VTPLRSAAIGLGVGVLGGMLWTFQSYAYLRIRNRLGQMSFPWVAGYDLATAIGWACLAPVVFAGTSRFPLVRSWLPLRAAMYLVGMGTLDVLHAFVIHRLFMPQQNLWSAASTNTFVLNFLVVAVLVGIGHRRQLGEWFREREMAADALSSELRAARERATRLQSIPPAVLEALDRAIGAMSAVPSPRRTEQLVARLADYLRVAIECSDEEGITEARQQSLARSLAQFERLARTLSPPLSSPSSLTRS